MLTIRSTNGAWQLQHVLEVGVNVFGGNKPCCTGNGFTHVPLPEEENVSFLLLQSSALERTLVPCNAQLSRSRGEEVFAPFAPVALKLGAEFECGAQNLICTLHSLGNGDSQLLTAETQPVVNDGNATLPEIGSTMILDTGTQLQYEEEQQHRAAQEEYDDDDGASINSDDLLDTAAAGGGATMEIAPSAPQVVTGNSRFILPVVVQDTKRMRQEEEVEKVIPNYASWKVDDLRQELRAKGLDTKGLKADLVARLKLQHYPVEEAPNSFTFGYEPPAPAAAVKEEDMDTVEEEEEEHVPITPQKRNASATEGNPNDTTLPLQTSTAGSPQTPAVAPQQQQPAKLSMLAPVPFPMTLPVGSSAPSPPPPPAAESPAPAPPPPAAESPAPAPPPPAESPAPAPPPAAESPAPAPPPAAESPAPTPPPTAESNEEAAPPPAFHEMKLVELRKACEEKQLDTKGRKDVLINRLLAAEQQPSKLTRRTSSSTTSRRSSQQSQQPTIRILFTSFIASPKQLKQIAKLGGQVLEEDDDLTTPTHVVVNKGEIRRTLKLLLIMTQIGKHSPRIVHCDWLVDSLEQQEWKQDTAEYFPYEGNTSLLHALQLRDEATSGLFSGLRFFLSNDTRPNFDQFSPIIRQAGGELELLQSPDQLSDNFDAKTCVVVGVDEKSFSSAIRERISATKLTWVKPKWILMCITSYSLSAGSDVDLILNLGSFF